MRGSGCSGTRAGFTLLELIVVLGIVALLLGLTVSASVSVLERSRVAETETTLRLLDEAMRAWEVAADRRMTWWREGDPGDPAAYDVHGDTHDVLVISEMLPIMEQVPAVHEVLARLDERSMRLYEAGVDPPWIGDDPRLRRAVNGRFAGRPTVLDAWGAPVRAIHPGRPARAGERGPRDADGTIRTRHELICGVARARRVTFVSAGPDGDLGHMFAPEGDRFAATMDNLYSAPVRGPYVVDGDGGGSADRG